MYLSFDWVTVILQRATLPQIFDFLHIDNFDDVFKDRTLRSNVYGFRIVLNLNGIRIELDPAAFNVTRMDEALAADPEEVLQTQFLDVRLDLSGEGLRFIRTQFFNHFDFQVSCLDSWRATFGEKTHFTRLDFALDLVNEQQEVLPELIDHLRECERLGIDKYRCQKQEFDKIAPSKSYSVKSGGTETTVYLGTPTSSCLLRIYDKKKQMLKKYGDLDLVPFYECTFAPDLKIDGSSWVRFELQARDKLIPFYMTYMNDVMKKDGDVLNGLKQVLFVGLTSFAPISFSFSNRGSVQYSGFVLDHWQALLDQLIQEDLHFIQLGSKLPMRPEDVSNFFIKHYFTLWMTALACSGGLDNFVGAMKEFVVTCQTVPDYQHKWDAWMNRVMSYRLAYQVDLNASLYRSRSGIFRLNDIEKLRKEDEK